MVSNIQAQFNGLIDGYRDTTYSIDHPLSTWAFIYLNGMSDFGDIKNHIYPPAAESGPGDEERFDHCSALIKILDDFSDIYASQVTWSNYYTMLRIFKRYEFSFKNKLVAARKIAFSSYPGTLSSTDDFYMMDSKLLVMETTYGLKKS